MMMGSITAISNNPYYAETTRYIETGRYLEVMKLDPKAKLPQRAHKTDAGADLFSTETTTLSPGESALIKTGLGIKVPPGYVGEIHNRSSQRINGITSLGVGIIDADYRGELKVFLLNQGDTEYKIIAGETKIAQLLIKKVELVEFKDFWNDTERGAGGFGSTS
jgi:dUTP pyrophosphatase